jgi:molybdate transport system substrate-binding protein
VRRGARRSWARAALGVLAAALLLTGCGSAGGAAAGDTATIGAQGDASTARVTGDASTAGTSGENPSTAGDSGTVDDLSGTLTVFAAASLKASFDRLRTTFLQQHPAVDFPEINYDGSSTLVEQLQQGASADVFASADENNMDKVAALVARRVDFATNTLRIAVAPGNPKGITSLADLAKPGVITVICAAEVPCGAAAHRALDAAGVALQPASEEENVKAVLTKVASGDADAGLVYATDVTSSDGAVDGIEFPQAADAVNTYPIAVLADAKNPAAARAFVDLVTGDAGRRVLAAVGFGAP